MFQDKEYKWGNECSNRPSKTANLPLARCHYAAYSCRTSIPCSYANGGSFWSGSFMAPCQRQFAVLSYSVRWESIIPGGEVCAAAGALCSGKDTFPVGKFLLCGAGRCRSYYLAPQGGFCGFGGSFVYSVPPRCPMFL